MSKIKSFEKWTEEEIRNTFGLKKVQTMSLLDDWLAAKHTPDTSEQATIEYLRLRLSEMNLSWNEDELKFFFISPFVSLVRCWGDGYNTYSQRTMQATVNGIDMRGRVEVIVASGEHSPRHPYFFIHEYKPSVKGSHEPVGQLLAAMITAQELNKTDEHLLGCYVIGKDWQFVVLEGNKYAISDGFVATSFEQLLKIYSALIEVKLYVEKQVQAEKKDTALMVNNKP